MPVIRLALLLSLALTLPGCHSLGQERPLPPRPAVAESAAAKPGAAAEPGPAANDNLNAVVWMQTAVEYRLLAGQTWRSALVQLDRAIKTPGWDALSQDDRLKPAGDLPTAVIVDVDETVLDNLPYQARLLRAGSVYDDAGWERWVREQAAGAVPGALEFTRAAAARGVTVFYVSNRRAALAEPTIANLRKLGFPLSDPNQFLGLGRVVEGCVEQGSDKGCRRQWVGRSHRVLMQVGDQIGDMVSVTSNTLAGRESAVRPYLGWIGERWFVLPNPSYGSWEPALFDNDWKLPEARRRQRKLDALRY